MDNYDGLITLLEDRITQLEAKVTRLLGIVEQLTQIAQDGADWINHERNAREGD